MTVKGRLSPILPIGYVILPRPNKAETAVHGCHCPGDMAERMQDCGLMFECVTCFNCLKGVTFVVDCVPIPKNMMTHPQGVAENRPLQKRERTGKEYGYFLFV